MSTPRRPSAGRRPARPAARPRTTSARSPRVAARTAARPTEAAAAPSVAGRGGAGSGGSTPRRSPLTPRGAVLGLLVCGLLLSAALPLKEYLAQRERIAGLEQAQADTEARVAELRAEKARLQDPAYIAAEARRRLHFVLPGETAYVVLPPEDSAQEDEGVADPDDPWWSQLWSSVEAADRPDPAPAP